MTAPMRLRMFVALARKELTQLAPLWVTLGCLHAVDLVFSHLLKPSLAKSWAELSWLSNASSASEAVVLLVLATITAYNLMPGEHAQGTIRFLYTLPVRRRWVFITKATVGAAILFLHNAAGTIENALSILGSQDSFIREQASVATAVAELVLESAFALISLCYGLFLSFFRRLGWLLMAAAMVALVALSSFDPRLSILNPLSLFDVAHHGTQPIIAWRAWALHGGLAALSFTIAMWLWLQGEERFAILRARFATGRRLKRVGFAIAAIAVASISGAAFKIWGAATATSARHQSMDESLAVLETKHYRFSYRLADEGKARVLALQADDVYERTRGWLGGPMDGRIVVDLTYDGIDHAGLTSATKIRMDVGASPAMRLRAIQHETIHALTNILCEGTPEGVGPRGRFLAEAIAEYGEHELALDPLRQRRSRLIAALARRRFKIEFDALLDTAAFLARHDEFLLYALGEVWVAALVQTCGRDAPGRLVVGFAAPGLPRNAEPIVQWRHVMQNLGCGLDPVRARYEEILARLEPDAHDLPIARARFVGFAAGDAADLAADGAEPAEGEVDRLLVFEVQVEGKGPGPWPVLLKVREKPDTPLHQIRATHVQIGAGEQVRATVPASSVLRDGFDFQVGAALEPGSPLFHSRWQTVVPRETNQPRP